MARAAASNVNHVKIEKVCAVCHSRSFANKSACRACGSSLDGAYTLLPGQWPPLGVPPQVLVMYEPSGDSGVAAAPCPATAAPTTDNPMDGTAPLPQPAAQTSISSLSTTQLKAEITKLERSLGDTLLTEGSPLRIATTQTISELRSEMASRKSSGQQLDQALAKEKLARQAREAAATHIQGLEQSLETARRTFQQAKEAEDQAAVETSRIRAQLAETDCSAAAQESFQLPVEVSSAIFGILRQAGIPATKVGGLLSSLGVTDPPPQPPPPIPVAVQLPGPALRSSDPGHPAPPPSDGGSSGSKSRTPRGSCRGRASQKTPRTARASSHSSRATTQTAKTALDTQSGDVPVRAPGAAC